MPSQEFDLNGHSLRRGKRLGGGYCWRGGVGTLKPAGEEYKKPVNRQLGYNQLFFSLAAENMRGPQGGRSQECFNETMEGNGNEISVGGENCT